MKNMKYAGPTILALPLLCEAMQNNPIGATYLLAMTAILAVAYVKRGAKP